MNAHWRIAAIVAIGSIGYILGAAKSALDAYAQSSPLEMSVAAATLQPNVGKTHFWAIDPASKSVVVCIANSSEPPGVFCTRKPLP